MLNSWHFIWSQPPKCAALHWLQRLQRVKGGYQLHLVKILVYYWDQSILEEQQGAKLDAFIFHVTTFCSFLPACIDLKQGVNHILWYLASALITAWQIGIDIHGHKTLVLP